MARVGIAEPGALTLRPMTKTSLLIILFTGCCLTLKAQINAAFAADKTSGCSPLVVHFSNQSTGAGGAASYHWDLGNGNTVVAENPQAVYTIPGSYTVTLTVTDGGQTSTTTGTVTVDQPPVVSFTNSGTKVCTPTPVTFISTAQPGSSAIASYLWDFGDGSTAQAYNPTISHVYAASGTDGVSLTVTDADGCSGTQKTSIPVTVLPALTAGFTTSKQVLCVATDPVTFTNISQGPGTLSYQWAFGDGGSSTQTSPTYSYATKGTYTVTLTVTSSEGCTATDEQQNLLNVANYQTNFTVPTASCQGSEVVFSDISTPAPSSETWTVDGNYAGSYSPLYYYFSAAGTHSITLSNVYGTCPQAVTKSFTVNPVPVPVPFTQVIEGKCGAPVTVDFTDHTPGAVSWAWNFNATPYPNQTIVMGGPANSYVYGLNGGYQANLTVTNAAGCSASISEPVLLSAPSYTIYEADNQPESSCGGSLTKTFGISTPSLLKSWTWNFGDGTTSTALEPTHTFSVPGQYNTVLNWTDLNGCTGQSQAIITIISPPLNVEFTATPTTVCVGQPVSFSDPNFGTYAAIYTTWSFGDGVQSISLDGAVHTYEAPGVYTVSLAVESAGCQQTVTKTNYITVLAEPTVGISHTNTCAGTRGAVVFTVGGGASTSLSWNFGDGTTGNTAAGVTTLTHTYTTNGVYNVVVTASNGNCTTVVNDEVFILLHQRPVLSATAATVCPDGTLGVQLAIAANPEGQGYYEYGTDFQYGDGTTYQGSIGYIGQASNVLSYQLNGFQSGESGLRVVTTSYGLGCRDTSNIIPLAIESLTAGYTIEEDDRCYQQPVLLQANRQVAGGDAITSWLWNFGDGTTSAQPGTVSHIYASPGSYTVTLNVTDKAGCGASSGGAGLTQQVTVNGPQASFYSSLGNAVPLGSTIGFINTSNVYGTAAPTFAWTFGDGTTSTAYSPSHLYAQPGAYTVTLSSQDASSGCVSTTSETIVVQPFNSAFQMSDSYVSSGSCPPETVQFYNTSYNYVALLWNFGDGETVANVADPSHVYAQPGTYYVSLTVVNGGGQTLVTADSVIVREPSAVLAAPAATAVCLGQADTLYANSGKGVKGYTWDFGDGVVGGSGTAGGGASGEGGAADSTVTHVYTAAGLYTVRLVVTDTFGCAAAGVGTVQVDVQAPPVAYVTPPVATMCLNGQVVLTANGGATYSWQPATGLSAANVSSPVATPAVSTTYTVTVADDIGCTSNQSIGVTVVQPETLSVTPDSTAICPGKSVTLVASGTERYQWIGSTGGLSATDIADPVARPAESVVYMVAGGDTAGCFSDTLRVEVVLLPVPTVSAGPDETVQAETPVTLAGEATGDVVLWSWTPAIYLSCTDCAQPVCTPKEPEQYILTVTGGDGCTVSDTVVISLLCDESKVRIPDAFTPNGDGHNDRWNILGISEVNHLVIFDRWGEKVFERDHYYPGDADAGWDGTANGRPAPAGVYVYFAQMTCPTGGAFERRGTVVLVR